MNPNQKGLLLLMALMLVGGLLKLIAMPFVLLWELVSSLFSKN